MVFELTEEQIEKIKKFHPKCKKKYTGAISGGEKYSFSPTGIGVIVEYTCRCGKSINVTNYDEW